MAQASNVYHQSLIQNYLFSTRFIRFIMRIVALLYLHFVLFQIVCYKYSVGIATGCGLDDRGSIPGGGLGIFPFDTVSRPALGLTQPPIQWVPGALSLGVYRPGREADHSPPSSAEVNECVDLYLHPQYVCMAWCLVKHRDNFTKFNSSV
jgi:hypothetical protein